MYLDRILTASYQRPLIAVDALSRQQWETALAAYDAGASGCAWLSRPFLSWSEWLGERWDSAARQGLVERNRFRLDPHQTEKLWQRVIDESDQGATLVETAGIARSARTARRCLLDAGVNADGLRESVWQDDGATFLEWHRRFEACLDRNDWIDADAVLHRLNRLPVQVVGHDIFLLDPPRLTAEQDRLVARWRAGGFAVECLQPDDSDAKLQGVTVADPGDELRQAANWALGRLETRRGARVAVVVRDLDARRHEVESAFTDAIGARFVNTAGCRLRDLPLFGAALDALRLLSGDGGYALGRWLRSPFFSSEDSQRTQHAAALEVALRSDSRAQSRFVEAWRRFGIRTRFAQVLPDTTARIDTSLDRLPTRATPTGWTEAWQTALRTLGWQGFDLAMPDRQRSAWDGIWAKFAQLTPIVGILPGHAALDTLEQIAAAESVYEPVRDDSVLLLTRIDQVGPGFDGAWITGMTDDALPEPAPPNPLVPWRVQSAHRMPGTDPRTELELARQRLERLRRRVPEAILSCPLRVSDQPRTPSPFVRDWKAASRRDDRQGASGGRRIGARRWQTVADVAPPFEDHLVPGGMRTLSLQARCPVKAFCAARLKAEPLAVPARGIDSRLRGIIVHRVLERLCAPGSPAAADRIDGSIDAAFSDLVGQGDAGWDAQVRAERSRIRRLIVEFLEREAERPAFDTIAVEQRIEIALGNLRVKGRIDRTDRLSSGELILIDYKTGRGTVDHWFDDRLSDVQLPAYAVETGAAGILTVRFGAGGVEYRGAGRYPLALPGRFEVFDDETWARQISRWRQQLTELVDEFAQGDVRVPQAAAEFVGSDGDDHAGGAYAPMTRVGDSS